MDVFFLIAGLFLLFAGGETLVMGAVAISDRLKIPPLLVGLTVVALGTSAPELTVSIDAALRGAPDIVVGGVVGSNIANILLVLGAAAAIHPVRAALKVVHRDGFVLLGVSSLLTAFVLIGVISWHMGVVMVLGFCAYTGISYWHERVSARRLAKDTAAELASSEVDEHRNLNGSFAVCLSVFVAGCASVIVGADLMVEAAINIARTIGVSDAVIGLSVVAIGTSLPELAISVLAALRGHSDVALGNVIGSNLSNILVILGLTSFIAPIPVAAQIQFYDIWVMLAATIVLIPVLVSGRRISRTEGVIFLVFYFGYLTTLYVGGPEMVLGLVR